MMKNLLNLLLIVGMLLSFGMPYPSTLAQGLELLTYLTWHPGGQFLAGASYNFATGEQQVVIVDRQYQILSATSIPPEQTMTGAIWNLDGTRLAFATQEPYDTVRIFIWDVNITATPITVQSRHEFQQASIFLPVLAWSSVDSDLLAASWIEKVRFWDTEVGSLSLTPSGFAPLPSPHSLAAIEWHPSGQWIATHDSGDNLIITDVSVDPPQTVASWTIPDRDPSGLEWRPDGQYLAITDGRQSQGRNNIFILAWDDSTQTLEQEQVLTNDTRVQWVEWRGNRLLTMSEDRAIDIWDTDTWQLESVIERANWPVEYQWNALALTPDGTELAYLSPEDYQIVSLPIGSVSCTISAANGTPEPNTSCLPDSAQLTPSPLPIFP